MFSSRVTKSSQYFVYEKFILLRIQGSNSALDNKAPSRVKLISASGLCLNFFKTPIEHYLIFFADHYCFCCCFVLLAIRSKKA